MGRRQSLFDSIIRHRIDLARYSKGEAAAIVGALGKEDAKLVELLRRRLPHLRPGDINASRANDLVAAVRDLRKESLGKVHGQLRDDLLELAKSEGETVGRMAQASIGVPITMEKAKAAALRRSVLKAPIGAGPNATKTLGELLGHMRADDQRRLSGALKAGIRRQEPIAAIVKRIAGTRALGYQDGVLAISRREAETAARTAVVHVANAAQLEWSRANADVVTGSEWTSILDDRTCATCAGYNHGFVPLDDAPPPKGMTDIGKVAPPAHLRCRCTLVPVFDLDRLSARVPNRVGAQAAALPTLAPPPSPPPAARPPGGMMANEMLQRADSQRSIVFGKAQENAARKLEALGLVKLERQGLNLFMEKAAATDEDHAVRLSDARAQITGFYAPHDVVRAIHRKKGEDK